MKVCRGCSIEKPLSDFHCHNSGDIRGLLCGDCNIGLGSFKDDVGRLISAAKYIGDN